MDRLSRIGIQVPQDCVFCKAATETLQPLFFECPFTNRIWTRLLSWIGINRSIKGWTEELTWARRMARKKTGKGAITSYVFAMLIYSIWRERNMMRFQQSVFEEHRICREIVLHVHTRGRGQPKWQQTLHSLDRFA
ncbi:PREDICTED: uncharacterized protein LOC109224464 [Nicotiana attenuata]|uniref:uncharacterized protein LOC109224464 n=1 Tax=Nicotiana attenuata TaxID=49451 RepID=UPI000905D699|nr:PREDICTED: uncharacterized protein LOC109224464 [Nicotiana attenuata]